MMFSTMVMLIVFFCLITSVSSLWFFKDKKAFNILLTCAFIFAAVSCTIYVLDNYNKAESCIIKHE